MILYLFTFNLFANKRILLVKSYFLVNDVSGVFFSGAWVPGQKLVNAFFYVIFIIGQVLRLNWRGRTHYRFLKIIKITSGY